MFADKPGFVARHCWPLSLIRCGGPSAVRTRTAAKRALGLPVVPIRQLTGRHLASAACLRPGYAADAGGPLSHGPDETRVDRIHLQVTRDTDRPSKIASREAVAKRRAQSVTCIREPPKRTPAAVTRSISASAISGLVRAIRYSTGTPAHLTLLRHRGFVDHRHRIAAADRPVRLNEQFRQRKLRVLSEIRDSGRQRCYTKTGSRRADSEQYDGWKNRKHTNVALPGFGWRTQNQCPVGGSIT